VYTRNNHHLALYQKPDGKYHLEAVTLLEAVQRKQQGMDVIRKNHPEGYRFIVHFERNHYFYFGERDTDVSPSEPGILDRIFRTQKMTLNNAGGPYIVFRHNHETDIQRENEFSFKRCTSVNTLPSHKVIFTVLGEIIDMQSINYKLDYKDAVYRVFRSPEQFQRTIGHDLSAGGQQASGFRSVGGCRSLGC
jgi:hypothetical protein